MSNKTPSEKVQKLATAIYTRTISRTLDERGHRDDNGYIARKAIEAAEDFYAEIAKTTEQ